jgi:hypothetical protein
MSSSKRLLTSFFTYFLLPSLLASHVGISLMSSSSGAFFSFLFYFFLMIDILSAIFIPSGVIGKPPEIMEFVYLSVRLLFYFGWARPTIVMDGMVFRGIDICKRLRAQAE